MGHDLDHPLLGMRRGTPWLMTGQDPIHSLIYLYMTYLSPFSLPIQSRPWTEGGCQIEQRESTVAQESYAGLTPITF